MSPLSLGLVSVGQGCLPSHSCLCVRVGALRDLDTGGGAGAHGVGHGIELAALAGETLLAQASLLLEDALDVGVTRRLL